MTEEDEEFNRIERESMMRMKAVEAVVTRGGSRATVEMAREAAGDDWGLFREYMPEIHRLVELVRADEREACAKVCDDLPLPPDVARSNASIWEVATLDCAEAIRARRNT